MQVSIFTTLKLWYIESFKYKLFLRLSNNNHQNTPVFSKSMKVGLDFIITSFSSGVSSGIPGVYITNSKEIKL